MAFDPARAFWNHIDQIYGGKHVAPERQSETGRQVTVRVAIHLALSLVCVALGSALLLAVPWHAPAPWLVIVAPLPVLAAGLCYGIGYLLFTRAFWYRRAELRRLKSGD